MWLVTNIKKRTACYSPQFGTIHYNKHESRFFMVCNVQPLTEENLNCQLVPSLAKCKSITVLSLSHLFIVFCVIIDGIVINGSSVVNVKY